MKKIIFHLGILLSLIFLSVKNSNGQNIDLFYKSTSEIDLSPTLEEYHLLTVNGTSLKELLKQKPEHIRVFIPGIEKTLVLKRKNYLDDSFKVIVSDGKEYPVEKCLQYSGNIDGDANSVASISCSQEGIMGLVSNEQGNFVIGKIELSKDYVVYNDKNLKKKFDFVCYTDTQSDTTNVTIENNIQNLTSKCVKWYYETDYDLFLNKGSVSAVSTYIQGLFSQVATLYANDGMSISLKTLYVWNTTDPYTGTTTSNYLSQFGSYRTTFDGDLAHLIGLQGGGGVAFVNTLCSSNNSSKMAYSAINASYQNVPTYSWSVECVAHESGHNVASKHTHDCVWNGNNTPIDGCGPTAGYTTPCTIGPLPTSGGTIMSYCHLISSVGINFNNGFGPQPTALMQAAINNSACLLSCDTTGGGGGCSVPLQPSAISGNTSPCSGTTNNYSVVNDPTALSYSWTLPTGWSGTSTNYAIAVVAGSSSGYITVKSTNSCGSSPTRTLYVSGVSKPSVPNQIYGSLAPCSGSQNVAYYINSIPNTTSYTWNAPTGSTITTSTLTSTGPSVTTTDTLVHVNFGNRKGKITVKGNNQCGSGTAKSININFSCRQSPYVLDANFNIYVDSETDVRIFDYSGRQLLQTREKFIDMSSYPNGIYFINYNIENTDVFVISR